MTRDVRTPRVLAVATKSPWPPVGGGRAVMHHLFDGLSAVGAEVRIVALGEGGAPAEAAYAVRVVEDRPRRWAAVAHHALVGRSPTLARFRSTRLRKAVEEELAEFRPDVVHLEQLHLAWLIPLLAGRVPVVLREQNVESRILERLAALMPRPLRPLVRAEAGRIAAAEASACRAATLVAAISAADAAALHALAHDARIEVVPPAWPAAAGPHGERLDGDPPIVCTGSFDWLPNRDGARWLLDDVWPAVRRVLPRALLHLAGPGSRSLAGRAAHVVVHDAAQRALFDPRAIAVVPVRAGSGVRVRLLEAWSLGMPAVTTPVGGEGLVAADGDGALLAAEPAAFAAAVASLAGSPARRATLIAHGRQRLAIHEPRRVAARLLELYRSLPAPA